LETLGWIALALGAASLLRTVLALPRYRAWLRRGRVRDFPKGPTPPATIVVDGPPDAFLRQNYPLYEILASGTADADVDVRTEGEPRHELVVHVSPHLRPDPLFLRDAAAEGKVAFVPVVCAARSADEKLWALFANTDGLLHALLLGPRCARGAAATPAPERIARRPVCIEARGFTAENRPLLAVPLAAAPLLLAVCAPFRPGALTLLILVTLARIALAASVELRFVRDGTTLSALKWLPVAWLAEPWRLLFGKRRSATLRDR